jgi:hypothetical protein
MAAARPPAGSCRGRPRRASLPSLTATAGTSTVPASARVPPAPIGASPGSGRARSWCRIATAATAAAPRHGRGIRQPARQKLPARLWSDRPIGPAQPALSTAPGTQSSRRPTRISVHAASCSRATAPSRVSSSPATRVLATAARQRTAQPGSSPANGRQERRQRTTVGDGGE